MATKSDIKKSCTKNEKIIDLIDSDLDLDNFEPNLSTPKTLTLVSPKNTRKLANSIFPRGFWNPIKRKETNQIC